MPDLIAFGEPMIEFNQQDPHLYLRGYGGDASNFAIAAARQGAEVGLLTALGEDAFGQAFLDLWTQEGVDSSLVLRDPAAPTGVYFVTHGAQGHVFSYLRAGSAASRFQPTQLPLETIRRARAFHTSGITLAISSSSADAALLAMQEARRSGVTVSFDTNLRLKLWPLARARALIEAAIRLSDIIFPSLEDAAVLTGLADPHDILTYFQALGPETIILKLGADGVIALHQGEVLTCPGVRVDAVDATGAGDAFAGAFMAEWLREGNMPDALRYANTAAALTTTGYGAVAPIPSQAAVKQHLTI